MDDFVITVKDVSERERERKMVYPKNRQRPYWNMRRSEFESKPRLYISIAGENILENFAYRMDRPTQLYRQVLPEIFEKLGLPPETKASWNQKAGCSCGCSPGFVLTIPRKRLGKHKDKPIFRVDFWATIEGEAAKVTGVTDRVESRASQGQAIFADEA